MKVDDLTKGLRNKFDEIFSIKNSLSILDIPKQTLLEKGDLVILLDDKNKPVIVEFLKVGKHHIELKNTQFPKMLVEDILTSGKTKLFEVADFDDEYDKDHFINYNDLTVDQKKEIKQVMKNAEAKLTIDNSKFGKLCNESLTKTINVQNGCFTTWMNEKGHKIPNKQCLKEAYQEAIDSNNMMLKKRAAAAKCFHKIFTVKTNVTK